MSRNESLTAAVLPRLPAVAGVTLVGLLLSAVFFLSLAGDTLWQRVLQDAGHGPVFAGIAVLLLLMRGAAVGESTRSLSAYWSAFLAATALGIVTELLQYSMPGRSVSVMDAMHDAAGAALGLTLAWFLERGIARRRGNRPSDGSLPRVMGTIAFCSFTLLAWQPLQCALAYAIRGGSFPALLPLGAFADARFLRTQDAEVAYVQLPEAFRRPGEGDSMRLAFRPGARPSVQVLEPISDWRDFDVLALDVTNPAAQPARFRIRVHDLLHDRSSRDRFRQSIEIPAATRATIRIPLEVVATSPATRRMDMGAIANVMLIARQPLDTSEFYVTRVWLE